MQMYLHDTRAHTREITIVITSHSSAISTVPGDISAISRRYNHLALERHLDGARSDVSCRLVGERVAVHGGEVREERRVLHMRLRS